ncbi:unnamed protein product [Polarella glacialis]|uniref:CCHC-type domain-containing protein n=1 Tax=Polarella glacialis TaxID=89957 RepID=A0A813FJY0_POLGL|nr:unnamed protein product [Polarella glacialis]
MGKGKKGKGKGKGETKATADDPFQCESEDSLPDAWAGWDAEAERLYQEEQAKAEKPNDFGDRPSDRPDDFNGDIDEYSGWRRKTKLWALDTRCPDYKMGVRVLRSLKGSAWSTCEHLVDDAALLLPGGEQIVFAELDRYHKYEPQSDVQKRFEDAIYMPKKGAMDCNKFINDAIHRFTRLDEVLKGTLKSTPIPSQLKGFLLVKKFGLSSAEIAQLLAGTGLSWELATIVRGLKAQFSNHTSWEPRDGGHHRGGDHHKKKHRSAYHVDSDEAYVDEDESDGDDEEEDSDNQADENVILEEDDVQEALAAFKSTIKSKYKVSRKKMSDAKTGRQFRSREATTTTPTAGGPVSGGKSYRVDVSELRARTRCQNCGQIGHWKKECANAYKAPDKTGKSESKGWYVTELGQEDDAPICEEIAGANGFFFATDN